MKAGILNDLTKCIGCGGCAMACKQINGLPGKAVKLDAYTWSCVEKRKGIFVKRQCMHCEDPTCASVCPVAAIRKTELGAVIYEAGRCIGCRYCIRACPFDIPKYQWDSPVPVVGKCIMCYDKRLKEGREPACTQTCPTGATLFGDRDELLREARRRINSNPGKYVRHIYGEKQAGGTSVMYISSIPFGQLGFRTDVLEKEYPMLTWQVLSKLPWAVGGLGLFLTLFSAGTTWTINRRMKLAEERWLAGEDKEQEG